ncbi:MAG TPA: DUF1761 domain-containing protein [Candidatus Binatia bacterium]|jgi:hypothetical protein|nr:DUF1761 domain-containing protein [Candidatus Binatia bacterium]
MPVVPINYLAVLACGVSSMVVGSLWYGPLFGKPWAKLMGFTPEKMEAMKKDPAGKKKMMRSYGLMFLGSLVMAYVLAHAIVFAGAYLKVTGAPAGLMGALWNWLGFIVPVSMGVVLWDGKPWKLFFINVGHYLASLCVMGLILSLWK